MTSKGTGTASGKSGPGVDKAAVRRAVEQRGRRERPSFSRRSFMVAGGALSIGGTALGSLLWRSSPALAESMGKPVRPPTAIEDPKKFLQACIRCGLCGTVCENGCIRFFDASDDVHGGLTPYLDVRRRSCTLCMRCTNICPTGALQPTPDDKEVIAATVQMGVAVVDPDRCLSYLGRICGYCHDACPLPQVAIRLVPAGKPDVLDGCVGCGRCVEFCPQVPTAIDIDPIGGIKPKLEQKA